MKKQIIERRSSLVTKNPVRVEYDGGNVWKLVDDTTGDTLALSESIGSLRQLAGRTHRPPAPGYSDLWTVKPQP